jgi:hypothetical protein
MGAVTALGPDRLSVKTPQQRNLLIMTTANTVYRGVGTARSGSDLNVGDRVVVELMELTADGLESGQDEDRGTAREIRLARTEQKPSVG